MAERGRRKAATKGKRGKAKRGEWERTQDSSRGKRRKRRQTDGDHENREESERSASHGL